MITVQQAVKFCRDIDKDLSPKFCYGNLIFKILNDDDGGKYLYIFDCSRNDSMIYLFVSANVDGCYLELMYQNASKKGTDDFLFSSLPLKVES